MFAPGIRHWLVSQQLSKTKAVLPPWNYENSVVWEESAQRFYGIENIKFLSIDSININVFISIFVLLRVQNVILNISCSTSIVILALFILYRDEWSIQTHHPLDRSSVYIGKLCRPTMQYVNIQASCCHITTNSSKNSAESTSYMSKVYLDWLVLHADRSWTNYTQLRLREPAFSYYATNISLISYRFFSKMQPHGLFQANQVTFFSFMILYWIRLFQ